MSDIEIIEVRNSNGESGPKKRKMSKNKRDAKNSSSNEICSLKGAETEFQSFVIDRTESKNCISGDHGSSSKNEKSSSPWVKKMMSSLLNSDSPKEETKRTPFRLKKTCYNCDGAHNLSDCSLPRNMKRITEKQRQSRTEMRNRHLSTKRIVDDFGKNNFEAGILSLRLRNALGISNNDIPEYIYRMRRMGFIKGYPPGYLKKAIKNQHSDNLLAIHEIEPREEIIVSKKVEAPILDQEKIISYPGFNSVDDRLNDAENFKIPPFETFCVSYQAELQNLFKHQRNIEKKKSKKENKKNKSSKENVPKHKKFDDKDDDGDVIFIDRDLTETTTTENGRTPGEEEQVSILEGNKDDIVSSKTINKGESLSKTIGTPVLASRKKDGSWKVSKLPSLEAFSVGIIAFEAREECGQKGTFKKLMSQLRKNQESVETPEIIEVPTKKMKHN